ncbi:transcriptional regulator with XRE-family HTH domain [Microbacterium sp. AK009]|uniref:helix-turn-helix domain-containing protein n=1 Tax=Microbacterium sp. AK009 TaxID=2723068 RepID=UPI0015CED9D7|nr:helix-turn-helix transcriptional regulator [Microbacterium sp. AK009]NYF17528.1 transcriptional regulator with XRE-family HTH domain [Microbacterium sp. AK009]
MTPNPSREPAPIGARVADYRMWRGMTAQDLADAIPSKAITRAIIANLESGRKRDLTTTELLLIANALRISPLALLVDVVTPWEMFRQEGHPLDGKLTNAEMAVRLSDVQLMGVNTYWPITVFVVKHITSIEKSLLRIDFAGSVLAGEIESIPVEESWLIEDRLGDPISHIPRTEEEVAEEAQEVVEMYRGLLSGLRRLADFPSKGIPQDSEIGERVDYIRRRVVALIERFDLDYGASDGVRTSIHRPPLNPRTGRIASVEPLVDD